MFLFRKKNSREKSIYVFIQIENMRFEREIQIYFYLERKTVEKNPDLFLFRQKT